MTDFGEQDGQRFATCAVCGRIIALPDAEHMHFDDCQAEHALMMGDRCKKAADVAEKQR
jgi:hypothetical protein